MWIWIRAALIDWLIIILAIWLAYRFWWFIPIAIPVIGNRQHALAILGHDGAHRLICRWRWLNDLLTNWLVFYWLGLSLPRFREFHWTHHRTLNTPQDPELALKAVPLAMEMPYSHGKLACQMLLDLIGCGVLSQLAFLMTVRPRKLKQFGPLVFVLIVHTVLILTGWWLVSSLWFLSLITGYWMFFRYRVWSEHVGGGEYQTLVYDIGLAHRLICFPHNSHLHHEHHEHPGLAFYKLKREPIGMSLQQARVSNNFSSCR